MSQISEINEQILEYISKDDEFYQALYGKEDFTPASTITEPNDYNCGAVCNELEYLYAFIEEMTGQTLDDLPEPYIDIVVYFFTGLKRLSSETDAELIRRMESLIIREADWRSERFGTPWDIKNVFSYYVDRDILYYIPNHVLTDLLVNGDFENAISTEWTFTPSGDRSLADSFTGSYKVDFTDLTDLSQTIAVTAGSYILNCFVKVVGGPPTGFASTWDGVTTPYTYASFLDQDYMFLAGGAPPVDVDVDVFGLTIQRDSDSYYFNIETLTWEAIAPTNVFTTAVRDYLLASFFVIADGSYNISIRWDKIADFYLDHVEFGEKLYPAFELLCLDGAVSSGFASVWNSAITNYAQASFLDQDYMFATSISRYSDTFYQNLLNMVKASGVKGVWNKEFVF